MQAGPRCGRQFHFDVAIFQTHGIPARRSPLAFFAEARGIAFIRALFITVIQEIAAAGRHEQNIAVIGNARAAEMGVRKTVND